MSSFEEFRKLSGYSVEQLAEITGYTRQGLDYAFKNMEKGKVSKKFLFCLQKALTIRYQVEKELYDIRLEQLDVLQAEIDASLGPQDYGKLMLIKNCS